MIMEGDRAVVRWVRAAHMRGRSLGLAVARKKIPASTRFIRNSLIFLSGLEFEFETIVGQKGSEKDQV